jgi:hypothetical protein
MQLEILALCDAATEVNGVWNLAGIFSGYWFPQLPGGIRQCVVAVQLRFERLEQGEHTIQVHVVDEDGSDITEPVKAVVSPTFGPNDPYSNIARLAAHFTDLRFEYYGEYEVKLLVDGLVESTIPLLVMPKRERFN